MFAPKRDLVSIDDLSCAEIMELFHHADEFRENRRGWSDLCPGSKNSVAMIEPGQSDDQPRGFSRNSSACRNSSMISSHEKSSIETRSRLVESIGSDDSELSATRRAR